jgi:signal transduction histidine kinase
MFATAADGTARPADEFRPAAPSNGPDDAEDDHVLLADYNGTIEAPAHAAGRFARRVECDEHTPKPTRPREHGAPTDPSAAAAALHRENERLHARLRAQMDEVRASRARLVAAADAERRRLERDLHDGAQSRFVAVALQLRRAQAKAAAGSDVADLLESAIAELATGLDELRDLARGIHPTVLTDRGLDDALAGLAVRAPLPVTVRGTLGGRVDPQVEIAAYFAVSEALANVAKYAGATRATVGVAHDGSRLIVDITDDGRGGADPQAGSGLRGLADRVGALDGHIEVQSPRSAGTRVHVEIPCKAP